MESSWLRPGDLSEEQATAVLGGPLRREQRLIELLRRPEVGYASLMTLPGAGPGVDDTKVAEQVEIQAKYAGYLERQQEEVARVRRYESLPVPPDLDYDQVAGLSSEVREIFQRQRPATIGQASRIPGVTPAAISLLLVHLKRRGLLRQSA